MAYQYGSVEFVVIGLPERRPTAGIVGAVTALVDAGAVRLLDLVILERDEAGVLTVTEIDDVTDEDGFGGVELEAHGIAADEDTLAVAADLPAGSSAVLLVVELSWARQLAAAVDAAGGAVLGTTRIPADIVDDALTTLIEE